MKKLFRSKEKKPKNSLDLGGLSPRVTFTKEGILAVEKEIEKEQEPFKKKYGNDWFKYWWEFKHPTPDYDTRLKQFNECIYEGRYMSILAEPDVSKRHREAQQKRFREIYGPNWFDMCDHEPNNPYVNELLLQDAIKTGKWKELPDCLQGEYHKRVKTDETDHDRK